MNKKDSGRMARHLKNEAKKLSKASGLPYHQCLNQFSRTAGNASFNDFAKKNKLTSAAPQPKPKIQKSLPKPLVMTYYMLTAQNGAKRPNAKMAVEKHLEIGSLLKELYQGTEYNKRARKLIGEVKGLLDDWVQCEYTDQSELTNDVFFKMYYGDAGYPVQISPTDLQKAELVRKCYKAKGILNRGYHDCKPVAALQTKLDKAIQAINAWPVLKKDLHKGVFKKRIIPGTLVYVKGNKAPLIAFNHSFINGLVTAYGDSGAVSAARHEISIFRDQSKLNDFRPMRLHLPYGKWTCIDGTQVLYNRDYCPIWMKSADGKVSAIDADYWISYEQDEHFFNDGEAPWLGEINKNIYEKCINALSEWGVLDIQSNLMKLLPSAISSGDTRLLKPKNISKRFKLSE